MLPNDNLFKNIFQTVIFAIIFQTMNGHRYKLFENILNDVQTEGKGKINTVLHNYSKILYFDTTFCISVYGIKNIDTINFITVLPSNNVEYIY